MISDPTLRLYVTMQTMLFSLRDSLRNDERGQDTLEWVLMSGLIAAGIVLVLGIFTGALNTMVTNVSYCLDFDSATTCSPGL